MEFRFKFHLNLLPKSPIDNKPALFQIMAWHRTVVTSHCLIQWWPSLPTHTSVTKGRRLNFLTEYQDILAPAMVAGAIRHMTVSALPIYRGLFSFNNSRKTPIARPFVRSLSGRSFTFEFSELCAVSCYMIPRYIESIVWPFTSVKHKT